MLQSAEAQGEWHWFGHQNAEPQPDIAKGELSPWQRDAEIFREV